MLLKHANRMRYVLSVGLALLTGVAASADISPIVFRVEATNALGTDDFEVALGEGSYNPSTGLYQWSLTFAEDLAPFSDPGNIIATVSSASLQIFDQGEYPRVFMNFEIQAGVLDVEELRVQSALVSFPTMPSTLTAGRATAGFSISDVVNDGVPAEIEGLPSDAVPFGHGMHTSWYNGLYPDVGTEFAHLVGFVDANYGGSQTANEKRPISGFESLGEELYDISIECAFSLTAGDLMAGNQTWTVTPEPTGLGLMALAGLALLRRRV